MKGLTNKIYWGFIFLLLIIFISIIAFHIIDVRYNHENFDIKDDSDKIDLVYTWVNGNDPAWKNKKSKHLGEDVNKTSEAGPRYYNMDELKYSLRSVYKYANWINKIYIVVDDVQYPDFLNLNNPKIKVVKHSEIIDKKYLPLFNSLPIEASIHHIPGLSENFIYSNDDCFFGDYTSKEDLYNKCYWHHPDDNFYKPHEIQEDDPQWICSLKNGYWLLKEDYPNAELIVPAHVVHFCKKSLMYEIENKYPSTYADTMSQKTRAHKNGCSTICLPKMQYILGASKGIYKVLPTTSDIYVYYEMLDKANENILSDIVESKVKLFCINNASEYSEELKNVLDAKYNFKSPYEI
jgi:hypothetical protein